MRMWIAGPRMFGGLLRPGISFRAPPFRQVAQSNLEAPTAFVYVIKGDGESRKVGVSVDPDRRLGELQTGSHHPLSIEFRAPIYGASAFDVEEEAHAILSVHRLVGEWFAVPLNIAVAAIYGAAERAGASMKPKTVLGGPTLSWWAQRGILARVAILTATITLCDALFPMSGGAFGTAVIVGALAIVFT